MFILLHLIRLDLSDRLFDWLRRGRADEGLVGEQVVIDAVEGPPHLLQTTPPRYAVFGHLATLTGERGMDIFIETYIMKKVKIK